MREVGEIAVAQLVGDLADRRGGVEKPLPGAVDHRLLQQLAETGPLSGEAPFQGARGHRELVRDGLDRPCPGPVVEQRPDSAGELRGVGSARERLLELGDGEFVGDRVGEAAGSLKRPRGHVQVGEGGVELEPGPARGLSG